MNFTIDEKLCIEKKLSISELLFALAIKHSENPTRDLEDMAQRNIIVDKNGKEALSPQWNDIVDEILLKSTNTKNDDAWYIQLAKDFAKTFPTGKMNGTAYYYRCNTKELVLKLRKFFSSHPEYTPSKEMAERIIEAGRKYNLEMDGHPRYRVLAKYFISKMKAVTDENGMVHNEEISQLASYLENEGKENPMETSEEWLVTQRN